MKRFLTDPIGEVRSAAGREQLRPEAATVEQPGVKEVYFVCRRGNDSLVSARALVEALDRVDAEGRTDSDWKVMDVAGGVRAWSRSVDPLFPLY
jgi:rhodanese-related sulfurtransferase